MTFSSYAEKGRYVERRLPDGDVEKILRRGADVVAAIDAVRRQDLQNRQAYLQAMRENAQIESQNRANNFQIEADNRQRIIEQERRNAEQQARNAQIQGDQQEKIYSSLSGFSNTATKLYQSYREQRLKDEWADEVNKAYLEGLPPEKQLASVNERYTAQMAAAATDTQADVAKALGANEFAVESLRGLNQNRKQARLYAYSVMAGERWYGHAMEQFANNKTDKYTVIDDKGNSIEITPSQAGTSSLQEQVLRQMMSSYLRQYGLEGLKPEFLADSIQNIRKGSNLILAETRKGEVRAAQENRLAMAKDSLFDVRTPQVFHEAYESLRHDLGDKGTRDELMKMVFTARNESGDFQFSDLEIENILNSSFLHQPGQSIRDLYSNEIQPLMDLRTRAAVERHQTDESLRDVQNDQWTQQTRDFINNNLESMNEKQFDQLLETARRSGNSKGAAMIADMRTFSNEARNDKYYKELWTERQAMGLPISRQEVSAAKISTEMKAQYMRIAAQSEATAVPKETMQSASKFIEQRLRERSDVAIGGKADATLYRAKAFAEAQYRRDFMAEMMRSNDPGKADQYALGRFQQVFGNNPNSGQYAVQGMTKGAGGQSTYQPSFAQFKVNPTAPKVPKTYEVYQTLKKNPSSIDSAELIPRSQLERAINQSKANQQVTIPPIAQYIADQTGGRFSVVDIINRQAKAQGLEQIPLQAYERAQQSINPEFQRLVNYRPSMARTDRALLSSGQQAVYQSNRPLDSTLSVLVGKGLKREEAITMAAIMMAESGGRPDALNNNPRTGDLSYGLFQINMIGNLGPARMKQFGLRSADDLKDPSKNIDAAVQILRSSGLGAWGAYTNGSYKQFLNAARGAYDRIASQPSGNVWRQPGYVNPDVIEYITGDRTHPNYQADHGGWNKHEHIAFRTRAALEKAKAELVQRGYRISSERGGKHAKDSFHYQGLAIDVAPPMDLPWDKESERRWSDGVRRIVGIK